MVCVSVWEYLAEANNTVLFPPPPPQAPLLSASHDLSLVSVAGVMVSIAALQAVDPVSITGRRIFFCFEEKKEETASGRI
jgi:hypothetical protein